MSKRILGLVALPILALGLSCGTAGDPEAYWDYQVFAGGNRLCGDALYAASATEPPVTCWRDGNSFFMELNTPDGEDVFFAAEQPDGSGERLSVTSFSFPAGEEGCADTFPFTPVTFADNRRCVVSLNEDALGWWQVSLGCRVDEDRQMLLAAYCGLGSGG